MRIGILFTGDYRWAGGVYYSLSLIKLLQNISLTRKLTVVVIINKATPRELLNELPKENIEIADLENKTFFHKFYCKFRGKLSGQDFRFIADINSLNLSVLYPLVTYNESHRHLNCKVVYWMYDFQHKFLPDLFSSDEIKTRDCNFQNIVDNATRIIVSSQDSKKHFKQFYKNSNASVSVFNFVSLIQASQTNPIGNDSLPIPENYFIVCNQFWAHKNHITVLKALDVLLKKNEPIHTVFTGKKDGETSRKTVELLTNFIDKNALQSSITFTGFISREQQIHLIQHAKAVIQPSQFEGWSTVLEDAKALQKFLIVSDIPIHREQVNQNVLFFEPDNFASLAEHMHQFNAKKTMVTGFDYHKNIEQAKTILTELFAIQ